MPDIEWSESAPPATESAGLGAQRIQSLKTSLRVGLGAEHAWLTSGVGAGVHLLGSARAYYGPQSLVSSTGTDGRLMVTSDTSRLFHVGSAGTVLLGGNTVLSAGSQPVGGQKFYWAMEFGNGITAPAGFVNVTIPNSGFSGVPWTVVSGAPFAGAATFYNAAGATGTAFVVSTFDRAGNVLGNVPFNWLSIGSRTL